MENRKIKSRCIFIHKDKILLCHNFEFDYYFFPGGSSNDDESAEDTLRREIEEEFGSTIDNIKILTTIKNVGRGFDETITMFRAKFLNVALYSLPEIPLLDLPEVKAVWVPLNDVSSGKAKILPEYDYLQLILENSQE